VHGKKTFWSYDSKINIDIGSMSGYCPFCHALKWKGGIPGMYCSFGKVQLELLQPPAERLRSLIIDGHPEHRNLIDRSR